MGGRAVVTNGVEDLEVRGVFPPEAAEHREDGRHAAQMMLTDKPDAELDAPPLAFRLLEPHREEAEDAILALARLDDRQGCFSERVEGLRADLGEAIGAFGFEQRAERGESVEQGQGLGCAALFEEQTCEAPAQRAIFELRLGLGEQRDRFAAAVTQREQLGCRLQGARREGPPREARAGGFERLFITILAQEEVRALEQRGGPRAIFALEGLDFFCGRLVIAEERGDAPRGAHNAAGGLRGSLSRVSRGGGAKARGVRGDQA